MDFSIEINFINDTPFTVEVEVDNNPDFQVNISFEDDTDFVVELVTNNNPDFEITIQFGKDVIQNLGIQDIEEDHIVTKKNGILWDSGKKIADLAPALGDDENYVTDDEKTAIRTISSKEKIWYQYEAILDKDNWTANTQTLTLTGITITKVRWIPPVDYTEAVACGDSKVWLTSSDSDADSTVTFTNTTDPTIDLNIVIEYKL